MPGPNDLFGSTAMSSKNFRRNSVELPTLEQTNEWLHLIGENLVDYLPPTNRNWAKHMHSCFEVAALGPDRDDVFAVGAKVFYKIAKNHYLVDGNKRSAVICTVLFFLTNGLHLTLSATLMYELAKVTVKSKEDSETCAMGLRAVFKKYSEPFKDFLISTE